MNGLPEGFVIDQPAVAPPEGFVIDQGSASSMASRPPQVDAYQPGKAWNEQPFSYRTQWENKAEDELSGKGSGLFGIAEAVYGRKQQHTAADVQARAEEMAKASGYAPSFGDWEERKKPDRRTIMNAGNPGMMIESRGVWEPKTFAQDGEELIDLKRPKMGAVEAGAKGVLDITQMVPGVKSIVSTLATPETNPYRESFGQTPTAADFGRAWDAEAKRALEDQPLAFRGGQAVSLLAGGQGALYEKGVQVAPRLIAPSIAAKAGPAAKFIGRVAAHSGVGALDYALYEGIAGANNDARLEGGTSADVTLGDRAGKFGEAMTDPLSYAFGPATLAVSRLGNGLVNSGKNSVRASIEAGGPRLRGGDMTPRRVQEAQLAPHKSLGEAYTAGLERVLADNPNPQLLTALENTPFLKKMVTLKQDGSPLPEGMTQDYVDAIKHALKRGLDANQIEAVMKAYHYGGYGSVDEALGLLSNSSKVEGLNVALANIPGDAQGAWRDFFEAYRTGSPEVIQRYLSRATGVEADDYAGFVKGLERKKVSEASPLYEASASKPVSPETWDNQILPAILRFDGGPKAIREAAGEVASGQHPGSLEAASELHRLADQVEAIHKQAADVGFAGGLLPSGHIAELSQQVGSAVARPKQVSTRALIELDKFLGGRAKSISKDRPELAGKYRNTSAEIRGTGRTSGLDPETGYNEGRAVSRSYKTAIQAAESGSKAFANGKSLRTLVDDIKLQIDGEMDDLGKAALLMGWMRSAEDAIESSGGSAQVINRLYGSANQRKKMLAMIPTAKSKGLPGAQGDQTKRINALGGGKITSGGEKLDLPSIFDRQRKVLNAEKRMTGGSPTAGKAAAVFGESEVTRFIDGVFDVVLNPVGSAKTLTRKVTHAIAKPPVYKEGINRELGNIMTTTGKQGIEKRLADIRKVQGMNAPRGGRAPNALAPKGPIRGAGVGKGTRTADLAAIGALTTAPPAKADTGDGSAELQAVKDRVSQIETTAIPELQEQRDVLRDPNSDPVEKQRILLLRGYPLGTTGPAGDGVDGVIGTKTRDAIIAEAKKIEGEIGGAQEELNLARDSVTQLEMRAAQENAQSSRGNELFGKVSPWVGTAAGIYLGYRTRGGAVKKSDIVARDAARTANALLNSKSVTRGVNAPRSANTRAANLNDFWRQGGAGENVPFTTTTTGKNQGKFRARPNAAEPSALFPSPPRFNSQDAAIVGTGLAEGGVSHLGMKDQERKIKEAKADVEKYAAAGDVAGMQRALKKQQSAEVMHSMFVMARNAGLLLSVSRVTAGLKKPYAKPTPDIAAAERERALVLQSMKK